MSDSETPRLDYDLNSAKVRLPISGAEAVLQETATSQERSLMKDVPVHQAHLDFLMTMLASLNGRKPEEKNVLSLFVPDQEFLLVEASKLIWIDGIWDFRFRCGMPRCSKRDSEQSFDLKKLKLRSLSEGVENPTDPTITVTLPRTKKKAVVGLITGKQERILMEDAITNNRINLALSDFQALRSLNGKTEIAFPEVENLPAADKKVLRQTKAKLLCGYNTHIGITCPSCGTPATVNMVMHPDFFFWAG
jgi:hypothetical protein